MPQMFLRLFVCLSCLGSTSTFSSCLSAQPPAFSSENRLKSAQNPSKKEVSFQHGFSKVVKPLLPAVVNVAVIKKVTTYSLEVGPNSRQGAPNDLFRFRDFLEKFEMAPKKRRVPMGAGSGFIIDSAGYVVTNAHVVDGADEVLVTLADQRELKAKVVGIDPRTDLALLKVKDSAPLPCVKWGQAKKVQVGHWAIVIGNALGLGGTVTTGVISHVGRSFAVQPSHVGGFFQTDASINMGNSGGPLFNVEGQVIGVNMMIASPTGGNIGIGFAIPSDVAQFVIEQLRKFGYVKRGWLGVQIQDITPDLARTLKLKKPSGALVSNVINTGPAKKAGLHTGDVILAINGIPIRNASQTAKVVGGLPIGSAVKLKVWRTNTPRKGYKEITLTVTLEESAELNQIPGKKKLGIHPTDQGLFLYGLTLKDLTPAQKQTLGINNGLIITDVHPESKANQSFQKGDVITRINYLPVTTLNSAKKIFQDSVQSGEVVALCEISRQGLSMFAAINLDDDFSKDKSAP